MKKNDIAIMVGVGVIAAIFSFGISQVMFGGEKKHNLKAEVVDVVSSDPSAFKTDPNVFNENAINPTKLIQIGDGSNTDPF